jgi:hypothetical protein
MASHASASAAPGWFRAVALVAVLWNAFGVAMYLDSVGVFGDPLEGLNAAERAFATSVPSWVTAAFATGTLAGLLGSIGLLLRRRWAGPVLVVSLAALLVLEGWIVFFSGALELFGLAFPIGVVFGAMLLASLASGAARRGWLR